MPKIIFPETIIEDPAKVAGVEHARDLYNASRPGEKPITSGEYLGFIAMSAVASYTEQKATHDKMVSADLAKPVKTFDEAQADYEAAEAKRAEEAAAAAAAESK